FAKTTVAQRQKQRNQQIKDPALSEQTRTCRTFESHSIRQKPRHAEGLAQSRSSCRNFPFKIPCRTARYVLKPTGTHTAERRNHRDLSNPCGNFDDSNL
ncbi:Hypothetical predicted protein, partial [Prunus dulcis]